MHTHKLYVLLTSLVLLSCAGQVPPSGGPVDTDPPVIEWTYPERFTTHFADTRIALRFDEYVDRRSVEESIFISPHVGTLEFDWSGRRVDVRFSEPLRENTTYVVNVGTDVVDIRNRNRMAEAFSLAFSTGDVIDRGIIEGRLYPAKPAESPEGVMVFAYRIDPFADTLNPAKIQPDYITQSGNNGFFSLRHLGSGTYRIVAVRDEFRNILYDPEADDFGVLHNDLQLTEQDTLHTGLVMKLAREDTTAPTLLKVEPRDRSRLVAEFSEPLELSSITADNFRIVDTLEASSLHVKGATALHRNPSSILLVTERQEPGRPYRLEVFGVRDRAGNVVHPLARALAFRGSALPDTSSPALVGFSVADSARGIDLLPEIEIAFSDLLDTEPSTGAFVLRDSVQKSVPMQLRWLSGSNVRVQPLQRLNSRAWYALAVDLARVVNVLGVSGPDTVRTVVFQTVDEDDLSAIEGEVVDRNRIDTTGSIVVRAEKVSPRDRKLYEVTLSRPGRFEVERIPEGEYVVSAFRDRNNNGVYDAGRPFPFEPAERFVFYADTLRVRARWPLEGVRLELR